MTRWTPTKIFAGAYPCEERDGYAWVYVPEAGAGRVGEASCRRCRRCRSFRRGFAAAHLTADLPCNVDHGIIGLMDPAHGPFVHQAWWWRSRASIHEKTKHFEPMTIRNKGGTRGFGCRRMRRARTRRRISCWGFMASR